MTSRERHGLVHSELTNKAPSSRFRKSLPPPSVLTTTQKETRPHLSSTRPPPSLTVSGVSPHQTSMGTPLGQGGERALHERIECRDGLEEETKKIMIKKKRAVEREKEEIYGVAAASWAKKERKERPCKPRMTTLLLPTLLHPFLDRAFYLCLDGNLLLGTDSSCLL